MLGALTTPVLVRGEDSNIKREPSGLISPVRNLPPSTCTCQSGLLFVAPWRAGLAVVVDGTDLDGFARAAEHVPIRTGSTVPDYGA